MYVENIDDHYNVCMENERFFLGQPLDAKSLNIMAVPSNKDNLMSTRAWKDNQLIEKRKQQGEIVFNVIGTKYDVVRDVGRDIFNWVLTTDPKKEWDVAWIDYITDYSIYFRLKPYQKVSFFPGIKCLARKDQLGRNLMRLKKLFPNEYDFFPETFILPFDYEDFRSHIIKGKHQTVYIVKPQASCQGKGIFLTQTIANIDRSMDYVAQKYLTEPLLIDGLKFDMRIYVLVTNCDPLKIYVHEDGLVRFATEPYQSPRGNNLGDVCMHLTNYAINKNNPNFVFNDSAAHDNIGHKRSIKALMNMLEELGHDVDGLWIEIKKIIIKTFCSGQSILANTYKSYNNRPSPISNCFQILGFDVMLDRNLKPWLIEVNQSPSWTTDTPLDTTIKENVITDALKILNISAKDRIAFKKKNKEEIEARSLSGKTSKPTEEQLKAESLKNQEELDKWESSCDTGGYEMIFPLKPDSKHEEDYNAFLEAAKEAPAAKEATPWKAQIAALELVHEKFNQVLSPKVSKSPTPVMTAKTRKQDAPLKERKVEKVDSRRNSKNQTQKTPERPASSKKRTVIAEPKEHTENVVRDIKIESIEEENKTRDITPPVINNHHNHHSNHNNSAPKKKASVPNKSAEIIKKIQRIEKALIKIEDLDDLFEKNIHASSRDLLSKTSRKHADNFDRSPIKYQHAPQSGSFQRQLAASILERLTAGKKQRSKGSMHLPSDASSSALRFDLSTTNKLAIDKGLHEQKSVYYPKRFIQQMTNPEVRKTLTSAQTLRSENISVALDQEREMLSPNRTAKSRKQTPMMQSQSYGKVMFGRERSNQHHAETFFVMPKRVENSYSNLSKTRGSFNSSYEKPNTRIGNFNEVEGLISVSNMIKSSVSNYAISRRAEK